ncbi:hypothetical protein OAO24_03955 [Methylophilaceae bacterium]|nr:hypothetical protein [Methylophilaceae bacterium]
MEEEFFGIAKVFWLIGGIILGVVIYILGNNWHKIFPPEPRVQYKDLKKFKDYELTHDDDFKNTHDDEFKN